MRILPLIMLPLLIACSGSSSAPTTGSNGSPSQDSPILSPASTTFIYRVSPSRDKIYRASVNLSTGAIVENGSTDLTAGDQPTSIAISTNKKFLFVSKSGANKVATYAIDQTTGELTFASDFPTTTAPLKLTIDPSGRFLFGLEYSWVVSYTLNSTTGAISWQGATSISGGGLSLEVDPAGKYLYKSSSSTGLQMYTVNQSNATLSSPTAIYGTLATQMKLNPATTRLFGVAYIGTDSYNYAIDPLTGLMSFTAYMTMPSTGAYSDLEFNSTGTRAYFLSRTGGRVESFAVDPTTGAITFINAKSLPALCEPRSLSLLASGEYIFTGCTDASGKTIGYKIEASGALGAESNSQISGMSIEKIVTVTL